MSAPLLSWDRDDDSGHWYGWLRVDDRRVEVGSIDPPEVGRPRRWYLIPYRDHYYTGAEGEADGLYLAMKRAGDTYRARRRGGAE